MIPTSLGNGACSADLASRRQAAQAHAGVAQGHKEGAA